MIDSKEPLSRLMKNIETSLLRAEAVGGIKAFEAMIYMLEKSGSKDTIAIGGIKEAIKTATEIVRKHDCEFY